MRKIHAIAVDMDGTLLSTNKKILPHTKELLMRLQERGIRLFLVSGRPILSMLKYAEELELHRFHGVILCNHGGFAYDVKYHRILFETPIPYELSMRILTSLENHPVDVTFESGEYMLVEDVYSGVVTYNGHRFNANQLEARSGGFLLKEVYRLKDHIPEQGIQKILTIVEPAIIDREFQLFDDEFGHEVNVTISSPYYIEFVNKSVNKASGLKKLGIEPSGLVAFGDSFNDMEMLEYAGTSVAMGNAVPEIKEIATMTTEDCDHEGIYHALMSLGAMDASVFNGQ